MNCLICNNISDIVYNEINWCKKCFDNNINLLKQFENKQISNPTCPIHIIDNIYIGDINSSIDEEILNRFNISSIVIAGKSLQKKEFSNINYLKLEIDDSLEQDLISYLSLSNKFIENTLNKSSVLIHCYSGISRSASIIIGYLILKKKFTYNDAYELLKSKSKSINPNSNFVSQLKSLEVN